MNIYIVFGGPLYPMYGMSQVRVFNQIKCLSRDHRIVFTDLISKPESLQMARQNLSEFNVDYRPVFAANYLKGTWARAFRYLLRLLQHHFLAITMEELSLKAGSAGKQITEIAKSTEVEALMIHYWYLGFLFSSLDTKILRMIDTHYVVEENIELQNDYTKNYYAGWQKKRELKHSLKMQRRYFLRSDLVIVNSMKQKDLIHGWNDEIPINVTVNGQDIAPLLEYERIGPQEPAICFYGSLSNQFNRKALRRILTSIYPRIKSQIPTARLYVIGAKPPSDILSQNQDNSVIATGFVEDVRPWLSRCALMLLPLDTGSGFRGRAVEVMALGIPIVGTRNGLQSVGFVDREHGYIEETNEGIAARAIELLNDTMLLQAMSEKSRAHARLNFTLEATFGILSRDLAAISSPTRLRN